MRIVRPHPWHFIFPPSSFDLTKMRRAIAMGMSLTCFECVFGFYGAGFIFFTVSDENDFVFQLIHYLLNLCCGVCFNVAVVSAVSRDEFFDQCVEGVGGNVGV